MPDRKGWKKKLYNELQSMECLLDCHELQKVPEIHQTTKHLFKSMKLMEDNFFDKERKEYAASSRLKVLRCKVLPRPSIAEISLSYSQYIKDYIEVYEQSINNLRTIIDANIYLAIGYKRKEVASLLNLEIKSVMYFTNTHKILWDENFVMMLNSEIPEIINKNNLS